MEKETVIQLLDYTRKKKGIGLRELARLGGCDSGYLFRCFQGKSQISPLMGAKIAKALGLNPRNIFRQILIESHPDTTDFINEILPEDCS